MSGEDLLNSNSWMNESDLALINISALEVVDPLGINESGEINGHRITHVFVDDEDGKFNATDYLFFNISLNAGEKKLVYLYDHLDQYCIKERYSTTNENVTVLIRVNGNPTTNIAPIAIGNSGTLLSILIPGTASTGEDPSTCAEYEIHHYNPISISTYTYNWYNISIPADDIGEGNWSAHVNVSSHSNTPGTNCDSTYGICNGPGPYIIVPYILLYNLYPIINMGDNVTLTVNTSNKSNLIYVNFTVTPPLRKYCYK